MTIKSTTRKTLACDELWNERQAHISMQQSKEQNIRDGLRAKNHNYELSKQLETQRLNEQFWRKVWIAANTFGLMLIIYTLFQFI